MEFEGIVGTIVDGTSALAVEKSGSQKLYVEFMKLLDLGDCL